MKKLLASLIFLGLLVLGFVIFKTILSQKCEQQMEEAINVSQEKTTEAYEAGALNTSEGGAVDLSDGTNVRVHSFQLNEDGIAEMDLNLPDEVLTVKKGDTFEVNGNVYSVYDIYTYPEVDESCHIQGPDGGIAILDL